MRAGCGQASAQPLGAAPVPLQDGNAAASPEGQPQLHFRQVLSPHPFGTDKGCFLNHFTPALN